MASNGNLYTYDEILLSREFQEYTISPTSDIKAYWEKIFETNVENRKEFEKALKIHHLLLSQKKQVISEQIKDEIFTNIFGTINNEERKKHWIQSPYVRVAASVILIIGLSVLFSLFMGKRNITTKNEIAYNEIIVPSGEKSQVILPDGTHIWLNSESKLKYPSIFADKTRDVYLEGEAYFDVSKVKGSKFLVNTQGVKIEVLGTIFNVKSYPDEETVETSVVEGKVKVDAGTSENPLAPVYILPSERAIFHKQNGKFAQTKAKNTIAKIDPQKDITLKEEELIVSPVDIKNIISWKDHQLAFTNETFEEIAVKMARWYKIKVLINDEGLKKQRFTGKFVNNETFFQVMEAINLTTPINYSYDNNELIVTPKTIIHNRKKRPKI